MDETRVQCWVSCDQGAASPEMEGDEGEATTTGHSAFSSPWGDAMPNVVDGLQSSLRDHMGTPVNRHSAFFGNPCRLANFRRAPLT